METKFSKNIIFANNHPYLAFGEIDRDRKGFFNATDLRNATKEFSEEGVSDFLKEFGKKEVREEDWLRYIQNDKPYDEETGREFLRFIGGKNKERRSVKESETKRVYSDNEILIVQPRSYRSMVLYGYDAKWCYSSAATDEHYSDVKDEYLFNIIFNNKNKDNAPKSPDCFYKFLLIVVRKTNMRFFEDQTNRLLTTKNTYDQNMKRTDENSIRHMDFLFNNKSAMEELECSISSQIQT